jgi:hypothetical protein
MFVPSVLHLNGNYAPISRIVGAFPAESGLVSVLLPLATTPGGVSRGRRTAKPAYVDEEVSFIMFLSVRDLSSLRVHIP